MPSSAQVYVYGIFLEGARFDCSTHQLEAGVSWGAGWGGVGWGGVGWGGVGWGGVGWGGVGWGGVGWGGVGWGGVGWGGVGWGGVGWGGVGVGWVGRGGVWKLYVKSGGGVERGGAGGVWKDWLCFGTFHFQIKPFGTADLLARQIPTLQGLGPNRWIPVTSIVGKPFAYEMTFYDFSGLVFLVTCHTSLQVHGITGKTSRKRHTPQKENTEG